MILRLNVPFIDRSVSHGRIVRWHKVEGDHVDYGDDLFDLQIEQVARITGQRKARRLLSRLMDDRGQAGDAGQGGQARYESVKAPPWLRSIRVVAMDTGFLRKSWVAEGTEASVGDIIALLSTEAGEPIDLESSETLNLMAFRVAQDVNDDDPRRDDVGE